MLALLALAASRLGAEPIDLSAHEAYVRNGFSLEWVFQTPLPGEAPWVAVPGAPGDRPLSMRDLGLPGAPARRAFSIERLKPSRYTVMIPFDADEGLLASRTGVGLFLASVGQNWQIYLNGSLVRDEAFTSGDGTMRVERSVRGALVELDARYLRRGRNQLSIMIAGDPREAVTGLAAGGPYLIDAYGTLESTRREGLKLMLIGIYFFFGLYHAILFASRPKARSYLYFAIASGLLSVYLFCRTYIVYDVILDTRVIAGLEYASLFLLAPAILAFFDAERGRAVSVFAKAYALVFGLAAVLRLFIWSDELATLWRYTIALPALYALAFDVVKPMADALRSSSRSGSDRPLAALARAVADSGVIKPLSAIAVVGLAALLDAFAGLAGAVSFMDYGYLLLVFGIGATLAGQFVQAHNDSEALGADLARRVAARSRELESTLAAQEGLSVGLSEASERLKARLELSARDTRVAARVQQGFFPSAAPRNEAWDTAFAFIPAGGVSGDFYDFYRRGDRLDGLVVGDVTGSGIAPGLITVLARSLFHRAFHELRGRSLGSMLESINEELIAELPAADHSVSVALLRLDSSGGVEYSSANHAGALYLGADRARAAPLRPKGQSEYKGPPLGRRGADEPYTSMRFRLQKGDVVLVYTDGFAGAENVDAAPFGESGMLEALTSAPEGDAAQMLDFIVREWRFHVSGARVSEDATAVLLKRL